MKDVLRCGRCGTTYPLRFEAEWGRSNDSDGHGRDAKCTALIEAPHAARAVDPETRVASIVPLERCDGRLHLVNVADNTKERDPGFYPAQAPQGPRGVTRKAGEPA